MFISKKERNRMLERIGKLESLVDYLLALTGRESLLGGEMRGVNSGELLDEWMNGKKRTVSALKEENNVTR